MMIIDSVVNNYSEYFIFVARVIAGLVMIFYGFPKIKDLRSNAKDFDGMGFKPGILWGTIVASVEFFGGIFMLIGLLTSYVAVLFGFQMFMGAIWKITKTSKPFQDWSYDLILLALMGLLLVTGPGAFAF